MQSIVLIAGGSGLIGSRLAKMLRTEGYAVRLLSRSPKKEGEFFWNPAKGEIDAAALAKVDFVINLAGAGIADKRWTTARKRKIIASRVQSAALLFQEIERMSVRPKAYLSASAVGFYGNSGEIWVKEESAPADDKFLSECCQKWEAAADRMSALGLRVLKFRIGIVLAKEGGALKEILKPLRFGLGTYFVDGQAWWPWVYRDDVCRAFLWGIKNVSAQGVFNLSAPLPVRGKDLVQAIVEARRKFAVVLPVPCFALRWMFGEMSAAILNSNRVSSEKLRQAGFEFLWPELDPALRHIFAKK